MSSCQVLERRDKLTIRALGLPGWQRLLMAVPVCLTFGLLGWAEGPQWWVIISIVILGYLMLAILVNVAQVSVKRGLIEIRSIPIPTPGGRLTLHPATIEALFWTKVTTEGGRGLGQIHLWSVMAKIQDRSKPESIISFKEERHAMKAGLALANRLNELRPKTAAPVKLQKME